MSLSMVQSISGLSGPGSDLWQTIQVAATKVTKATAAKTNRSLNTACRQEMDFTVPLSVLPKPILKTSCSAIAGYTMPPVCMSMT